MPTHPPRSDPIKKLDILRRRETALRRAIAEHQDQDKLLLKAEDVREAQLQLLKIRLSRLRFRKGLEPDSHPGAQIEKDIQGWLNMKPAEIVDAYRPRP